MVGFATMTLSTSSVRAEETTAQSSYPLKSENAIPLGETSAYLSCAEIAALPPTTASVMPKVAPAATRKRRESERGFFDMSSSQARCTRRLRITANATTCGYCTKVSVRVQLVDLYHGAIETYLRMCFDP